MVLSALSLLLIGSKSILAFVRALRSVNEVRALLARVL
jgi:hypothetical protein